VLLAELFARAVFKAVVEFDFFFARAIQQHLACLGAQVFERCVEVKLVVLGQAFQQGEVMRVAAVPAFDGSAAKA
jgi:hypothetical protein